MLTELEEAAGSVEAVVEEDEGRTNAWGMNAEQYAFRVRQLLAEDEAWHEEQRRKLIGTLELVDQAAAAEAEQEDALLVQAELRSRRWQERSTGAALEEALYCTAQMDVAAHRAQGSARSASYTARQAALPAKASELPWQADGSAQAVEDALAEPVGSAAQREWERERASGAAERKALRQQAAAHDAEPAALRDELRTSLQAAKEAGPCRSLRVKTPSIST